MYFPYRFFYFPRIYPGGYIPDAGFSEGEYKSDYLREVNRLQKRMRELEETIDYVNQETVDELKGLLIQIGEVNLDGLVNEQEVKDLIDGVLVDFELSNLITMNQVKREVNKAISEIDVGLTELEIKRLINSKTDELVLGLPEESVQHLIDASLLMIDKGMNQEEVQQLIDNSLIGIDKGISETRVNEIITSRLEDNGVLSDLYDELEQKVDSFKVDLDINTTLTQELERKIDEIDVTGGVPGPVGPRGDVGPRGYQGETGPMGPEGRQGPIGERGGLGAPGERGPKGDIGPKGDRGEIGPEGPIGPKGLQGEKGDRGDTGKDGNVNFDRLTQEQLDMLKGETGNQGPQGDRGERGPRGNDGDVYFDNLTPEQVTSLQGPMGYKGEKGDKGDRGEQGDAGIRGGRGPIGPEGPEGPIGPVGPEGPKGQDGSVEFEALTPEQLELIKGEDGRDGFDGDVGPKGDTGPVGPIGPIGLVGPTGPIGPEGPEGPKGQDGSVEFESLSPEQLELIKGDEGPPGPKGEDGGILVEGEINEEVMSRLDLVESTTYYWDGASVDVKRWLEENNTQALRFDGSDLDPDNIWMRYGDYYLSNNIPAQIRNYTNLVLTIASRGINGFVKHNDVTTFLKLSNSYNSTLVGYKPSLILSRESLDLSNKIMSFRVNLDYYNIYEFSFIKIFIENANDDNGEVLDFDLTINQTDILEGGGQIQFIMPQDYESLFIHMHVSNGYNEKTKNMLPTSDRASHGLYIIDEVTP